MHRQSLYRTGHALRGVHRQDRARPCRRPRRGGGAGQFLGQARRGQPCSRPDRNRHPACDRGARVRGAIADRQSARARPWRNARLVAGARRGGLRDDEHHAALGQRLVGRGRGHARPVPLAVGADRNPGDRLFGAPVLRLGGDGVALPADQHGRADLDRRAAGDGAEPLRDRDRRPACLFRWRGHAALLPAGGAGSRRHDARPRARGNIGVAQTQRAGRDDRPARRIDPLDRRARDRARHGDARRGG